MNDEQLPKLNRHARWSPDNPFAQRIWRRTAAMGGKHRPSTPATDASVIEEEPAVDLMRELAAIRAEGPSMEAPF
ncbi:MAG: hypothetical protein AAGJ46_06645 [Planctomycetota bacterium]